MNAGNSYLIEVVVPPSSSTITTFTIQDIEYLRNKAVREIEVYTSNDLTYSPTGNAVISGTVLKGAYLKIYSSDPLNSKDVGQNFYNLPFVNLHRTINGTDPYTFWPYQLQGQTIVWSKTEIILGNAIGNNANVSFLINVTFDQILVTT
jgi:hypothetical protein